MASRRPGVSSGYRSTLLAKSAATAKIRAAKPLGNRTEPQFDAWKRLDFGPGFEIVQNAGFEAEVRVPVVDANKLARVHTCQILVVLHLSEREQRKRRPKAPWGSGVFTNEISR